METLEYNKIQCSNFCFMTTLSITKAIERDGRHMNSRMENCWNDYGREKQVFRVKPIPLPRCPLQILLVCPGIEPRPPGCEAGTKCLSNGMAILIVWTCGCVVCM